MPGSFVIHVARDRKLHFALKSEGGEPLLQSHGFTGRRGLELAIESVRRLAGDPRNYQKTRTASGEHFFVVKGAHGQVAAKSEMFRTEIACDAAMTEVIRIAPQAALVDAAAAPA